MNEKGNLAKRWLTEIFGLFKPKKTRSAESKAKQSEGMKKAWARRRAEKIARLEEKRLVGD